MTTDELAVTGIECFAHHGVFDFEKREGQTFVVDLVLGLDTRAAAASDHLDDTVNYGTLALDVKAAVERTAHPELAGRPLLVGASRKSFLGTLLADDDGPRPVDEREHAHAALVAVLASRGVDYLRVHDVRATCDALAVVAAMEDHG